MTESELDQIRDRYARRTARYHPWDPAVYMPRQEFERKVIALLHRARQLPPAGRSLLEIGCGHGTNLRFFLSLGFTPADLAGNELLDDRLAAAREALPAGVRLLAGDAAALELEDESFDVVFQSVVFSSILDPALQAAVARRMWSLVRPGGGVLWYDFVYDNPSNRDVRGVPLRRVRELFPSAGMTVRWLTLAPPIARRVVRLHPALYTLANVLPALRTHRLCWIPKPIDHPGAVLNG